MKSSKSLWQRLLALSLVVVLAVGLAACTSNDPTTDPTNKPPAVSTPKPSDAPAATDEPEDIGATPAKDMGGRDFTFACWWDYLSYPSDAAEPDPETASNYITAMMNYENAMKVYSDYNCTATNVTLTWDDLQANMVSSVMAGDPLADIIVTDAQWILSMTVGNVIVPYQDVLPADHDVFNAQARIKPTAELGGKMWAIDYQQFSDAGLHLGYNKEIIRAIGAEDPGELYDRGEWTYDKFHEIVKMATKDTDGDGVIDQYGIGGQANEIVEGLIASNDGVMVTADFKYGFDDPKTMRALELCEQIFGVDKAWNYDPESGASFSDWSRNSYAFREGTTALYIGCDWMFPKAEDRTFEYGAVPFPKGPDNTTGVSLFIGLVRGLTIPRGAKNPEDTVLIWDLLGQWYGDDAELKYESEMEYFNSRFWSEEDARRMETVLRTQKKFDVASAVKVDGVGYTWCTGGFAQAFYNGTGTPAQVVEEQKQTRQAMLDTIFADF